jgi:DNA-binding CsgD family transcriptional regulator
MNVRIDWPLTGRSRELRQVQQLAVGRGGGAVLAGPAGVGKTRLAAECLAWARASAFETAHVTATRSASAVPLGAMAPLLPVLHQGANPSVDNLPDLLRRSVSALLERASGGRLFLVVDDAHLLDAASATLLHQLAGSRSAFVLVTVRSPEAAPDAVVALWKDELLDRMDLGPLDDESLETLLAAALGGVVEARTVKSLISRSLGNVLFLRELVLGAIQDGTLCEQDGVWRLAGELTPSNRLVELVEARLSGLAPAARALIEVLAFGEPLELAELGALGDSGLVDDLERAGIVETRESGDGVEVGLAHPIYGEVVRTRVPVARKRGIARSLAEVVTASGMPRPQDRLRVATWRLTGGGGDPQLMLEAAVIARWRYDLPLAERLAETAARSGAGFDAELLIAQLAALQGRGGDSERMLCALAVAAETDSQRGIVAVTRLDDQVFWLGQPEHGLRIAAEAEAAIQDGGWRDQITARRAGIVSGTEGPRASAAVAEPLLGRAEGSALVLACLFGAYDLVRLGKFEAAVEVSGRGYDAHLAIDHPLGWDPCIHLTRRCEAHVGAGRFDAADDIARDIYEQASADGNLEALAWSAWQRAAIAIERGKVATAVRYAREAVPICHQIGRPQVAKYCLTVLSLALALSGRPEEAQLELDRVTDLGLSPSMFAAVELLHAQAWTAVAAGDATGARRLLEEAADLGERSGDLLAAATALHSLARLGYPDLAAGRLDVLAGQIEGELIGYRAGHAHALCSGDHEELEAISVAFEAMGADLLAAEAMAEASMAWRRDESARKAATARRRAQLLGARCEGAQTPTLQLVVVGADLSRIERDIAMFAASGLPNKEIAERMTRSVRTIENNLQHVYSKLGITSRTELKAVFGPE